MKKAYVFNFAEGFVPTVFKGERAQGILRSVNTISVIPNPDKMNKAQMTKLLTDKTALQDFTFVQEVGIPRAEYECDKFDTSIQTGFDFTFYFPEGILTHDTVQFRASKIEFYIRLAKRVLLTGSAPESKKAPQKRQGKKTPTGEKRATGEKTAFTPEFKTFLESKGFKENARGYRGSGEIIEATTKGFKCYFKSAVAESDKLTKANLYTGTHTEDEIRTYLSK